MLASKEGMPMSDRNALSPEQVRELSSQVVHGVPIDLDPEDYKYWTEHGDELNVVIAGALRRPLLGFVTTVALPAISAFDAGAHIVVTPGKERESAELVIGWVGDNATRLVKGKVEPDVAEATLRVHTLKKPSLDGPIIAELGGEEVVATTWGQIREMMRRQGRGQEGILLTNGCANIFYILDPDGVLWAADCGWGSNYADWDVEARPITYPSRWDGGYQVVSR